MSRKTQQVRLSFVIPDVYNFLFVYVCTATITLQTTDVDVDTFLVPVDLRLMMNGDMYM
jgi:hypothetical protein